MENKDELIKKYMHLTKAEMVGWIKELMKDIDGTPLSEICGKYCYIMWDGKKCFVKYFEGKYGYGLSNLTALSVNTIRCIYADLQQDFGDED